MPLRRPQPRPTVRSLFAAALLVYLTEAGLHAQSLGSGIPSPASGTPEKKIFEEWSIIVLDGRRCGFDSIVTTQIDTAAGLEFRTLEQQEFVVKRESVNLKLLETSNVIEDADGGVLSFKEMTEGAGSNIISTGRREGDDLVVSSRGQTARYHIPRLAALGPEAVRRMTDAVPLRVGQTFFFPTFESDYPQSPVLEKAVVVSEENRKVLGVARKLWKLSSVDSLTPTLATTSWIDQKNNDVESIVHVPGVGSLDQIVSSRADCMKQPDGAEIFATSLIRPQRALPSPHHQAEAIYRLTSGDATRELVLWNQGEQRVLKSKPGTIEIAVMAPEILPRDAAYRLPHADTPELHPYLQASAYLEVNSPEIQKLARQAVGKERNPVVAAHRIENFVRDYITKKDLNIGFASAEETAKSREGDCTEHAVLCAALGRAMGLPTRCVLGFGYIPPGVDEPTIANAVDKDTGIFGFHMWAEAWVAPDKWVAMDAALDGFDVGHIAITKTALEEVNPLADLNMPILQLMQNLKITILKTVPKNAATAQGTAGID